MFSWIYYSFSKYSLNLRLNSNMVELIIPSNDTQEPRCKVIFQINTTPVYIRYSHLEYLSDLRLYTNWTLSLDFHSGFPVSRYKSISSYKLSEKEITYVQYIDVLPGDDCIISWQENCCLCWLRKSIVSTILNGALFFAVNFTFQRHNVFLCGNWISIWLKWILQFKEKSYRTMPRLCLGVQTFSELIGVCVQ